MKSSSIVRFIARLLPVEERDETIGDLVEQFTAERRSRLWLLKHGLALAWGMRRTSGGIMSGLLLDIRLGLRVLAAHRQFSVLAIVLLALGIGVTTAIFTVVNAVLLRPLPYAEPERLVAITSQFTGPGIDRRVSVVRLNDVREWRGRAQAFESLGAFAYTQLPVRIGDQSFSPVTALMDPEFLPTLGKPPALGTFFDTHDDARDERAAIVSYAFWRETLGGDAGAIGRTIDVDGEPFVLRAVLAPDFQFPRSDASYYPKPIALMLPAAAYPGFPDSARQWFGIARLKRDVSLQQAESELRAIAAGLPAPAPAGSRWSVNLTPLADETTRGSREALIAVLGIAFVLLAIASTNLMNLFFSRAVGRLNEISIRRAIGCTTGRLLRQLLIEALLLALAGGAAGVLLASLAVKGIVALSPFHLPVSGGINIDLRVAAFTAAVCLAAAVAAAFFPALHLSSRSLAVAGTRTSRGRGVARVQQALCVAQIGLGVALLATAGLLARSFWELNRIDRGYDATQVTGFNLSVPNSIDRPDRVRFYRDALDAIGTIPGVERAGLISFLPPETRAGVMMGLVIDGVPPPPPNAPGRVVNTLITSEGYFDTMKMAMVRGRAFTAGDTGATRPVIILNETAARRFFDGADPVGRRVGTGFDRLQPVREVVGVVRDSRDRGAAAAPIPTVYIPFEQFSLPYGSIAIRASLDAGALVPLVRERLTRLNADVPLTDFQSIEQRVYESLREPRFYMLMAAVCAALAILFVTFGLYGLISYSVSRRSREIGIRMALGAERRAILGLVLRQGLMLAIAGIAAGITLAMYSTRIVKSLLFQIKPMDPATLALACALVVIVTLAASVIPARRASAINPVSALKRD